MAAIMPDNRVGLSLDSDSDAGWQSDVSGGGKGGVEEARPASAACTLRLDDRGVPVHNGLLKIPLGSTLRMELDPGHRELHSLKLWTNYPVGNDKQFERHTFHQVASNLGYNNNGFWGVDITIEQAGAFEFFLEYRDAPWATTNTTATTTTTERGPVGFFMVDPALCLRRGAAVGATPLPLEAVSIQTVLTRCIGPTSEWVHSLRIASLCGYNFIHFTPVQELGESGSCYSIFAQNSLAASLFDKDTTDAMAASAAKHKRPLEDEKIAEICRAVCALDEELELLSMVDVVLNHTASNSAWLPEHPEAGYNLDNSPHLRAAYELDEAILGACADICAGRYPSVSPRLTNDAAVDAVVDVIRDVVLPSKRLWEFYTLDADAEAGRLLEALGGDASVSKSAMRAKLRDMMDAVEAGLVNDGSGARFAVRVRDVAATASALQGWVVASDSAATQLSAVLKEVLAGVNMRLQGRYDSDMGCALNAIRGAAKYVWVGERKGEGIMTEHHPIVYSYFTRVKGHVLANNGFIWNGNPAIDFTYPVDSAEAASRVPSPPLTCCGSSTTTACISSAKDSQAGVDVPLCTASTPYMRREVVIWGDCVKLRYGQAPEDSPWLWAHMQRYVETQARIFHGFRLDNAHGTPLHVAAHMVDAARRVRPQLYVLAELFTGSMAADVQYVTKLGINALVREAMQAGNAGALASLVHSYGGHAVASVRSAAAAVADVVPTALPTVFCDCTHDNPTPFERHHAANALPMAALVSAAVCAVGSVRGFDELLPHNPSVVSERRRYQSLPMHGSGGGGCASSDSSGVYRATLADVGMHPVRRVLNNLRLELAQQGYTEIHVHHDGVENGDLVTVQRAHPVTRDSLVYVARTAFNSHAPHNDTVPLPTVRIEGRVVNVELAARLTVGTHVHTHVGVSVI